MTCVSKTIDSGVVDIAYAVEECVGVLSSNPNWIPIEPNSINDFGAELETKSREVLTGRQRKRGSVMGLTAAVAFEHDFVQTALNPLFEGFFCADTRMKTHRAGSLHAAGFGILGTAGQFSISVSGKTVKLVSSTNAFSTSGLQAGDWIFIGGEGIPRNRFDNNLGFARVSRVENNALTLDVTTWTPVAEDGRDKTVNIFFSHTLKTEKASNLIKKKSYCFERKLGTHPTTSETQLEYIKGCVANEMSFTSDTKELLKVSLGYSATDVEYLDGGSSERVKAGTRQAIKEEEVYSGSSSIYASRIYTKDNTFNPFDFVSSFKIEIKNNVSPVEALGKIGAVDMNLGTHEVSGSIEAFFTTVDALKAVRNNTDCGMFIAATVGNKGFVLDVPSMTLGGGKLNIEKNQPIKLPLESSANESSFGHTAAYCFFPYLPDVAMAKS